MVCWQVCGVGYPLVPSPPSTLNPSPPPCLNHSARPHPLYPPQTLPGRSPQVADALLEMHQREQTLGGPSSGGPPSLAPAASAPLRQAQPHYGGPHHCVGSGEVSMGEGSVTASSSNDSRAPPGEGGTPQAGEKQTQDAPGHACHRRQCSQLSHVFFQDLQHAGPSAGKADDVGGMPGAGAAQHPGSVLCSEWDAGTALPAATAEACPGCERCAAQACPAVHGGGEHSAQACGSAEPEAAAGPRRGGPGAEGEAGADRVSPAAQPPASAAHGPAAEGREGAAGSSAGVAAPPAPPQPCKRPSALPPSSAFLSRMRRSSVSLPAGMYQLGEDPGDEREGEDVQGLGSRRPPLASMVFGWGPRGSPGAGVVNSSDSSHQPGGQPGGQFAARRSLTASAWPAGDDVGARTSAPPPAFGQGRPGVPGTPSLRRASVGPLPAAASASSVPLASPFSTSIASATSTALQAASSTVRAGRRIFSMSQSHGSPRAAWSRSSVDASACALGSLPSSPRAGGGGVFGSVQHQHPAAPGDASSPGPLRRTASMALGGGGSARQSFTGQLGGGVGLFGGVSMSGVGKSPGGSMSDALAESIDSITILFAVGPHSTGRFLGRLFLGPTAPPPPPASRVCEPRCRVTISGLEGPAGSACLG
jgi:hypothetical protein